MIAKYAVHRELTIVGFSMRVCTDDFGNEVEISYASNQRAWYFLGVERALTDL